MKENIDWRNLIARLCIAIFIFVFIEVFMQIDLPLWLWGILGVGIGWL
jgi:hypothetical protein